VVIQPGVRLQDRAVEDLLRLLVRVKRFALFDADRLQQIDHDPIAIDPRLALHEAVERLKEAHLVQDRAVEQDIDRLDELRLGRIACL